MQTRKSRREKLEEKRAKRQPIMGNTQRLKMDSIPKGFVARWFNDDGSRIQDARNAGWEFLRKDDNEIVEDVDDMGTVIRQRVDKKASGEPLYAYLMVLEEEIYNEAQEEKQAGIDAVEEGLKQGTSASFGGRVDGKTTYVKSAKFD